MKKKKVKIKKVYDNPVHIKDNIYAIGELTDDKIILLQIGGNNDRRRV